MNRSSAFISLFIIISSFSVACRNDYAKDERLRQEALAAAEKYAINQLTVSTRIVDPNGVIILGSEAKRYIIDPANVITGLIDEDDEKDAIVTIVSLKGNYIQLIEHLIMISEEGKLIMIRSVESDMRILGLSNRIITAKVPIYSRNSPLYNCESCQETKNYRYINGILDEIK